MDQYALDSIRCRVHELVACQLFREDDREDLEQQLFLEYWKRAGRFNSERGTYKTFINRLIRNRAASLALKAIRSGASRVASLTGDDDSESPVEASAGLDDASRSSTAEAVQARLDVEKVLASVAPRVQLLAEEIRSTDFAEIAAKMGTKLGLTSRRTYQFREQLRAAFRTNGLAPAWQGAR
jgi:RNA polymerase sigma factor (sigma-70 family)